MSTGVECLSCGAVTLDRDPGDDCGSCHDDATVAVTVTPCDLGDECRDDAHHWGLGAHVEPVGS